jgi:hypothetical protein
MKNYFFLILAFLLLTPFSVHAFETIPAGFTSAPHIIPNTLSAGGPARIYSTIFNQSNFDLIGKLQFYYQDQLTSELPIALPAQSTERVWFDIITATGTQHFSEQLVEMKKTELGKTPELISLTTSTISIERNFVSSSLPISSSSTSSSTTNLITVTPPTTSSSTLTETLSSSPTSTTSTISNLVHSPLTQTVTEKTKLVMQSITAPLIRLLDDEQRSLEEQIKTTTTSQPIAVLDQAATELEKKTTFLKIPRDQLPTSTRVYIWLIGAAKYILSTWWIMLILLLIIIRTLWKLWRRIQRSEEH